MLDKLRNDLVISGWRAVINFILVMIMFAGLFFSRALLSAGMIGFVLLSFIHTNHRIQFFQFISTPLLWGMSLLFLVPLVSGAWSADKDQWMLIMGIKLPLLFLPMAFAGPIEFRKRQWEWIAALVVALILGATIWTMIIYLSDPAAVNESYLKAKTMITPLANDHVRFSWLVSLGVLISAHLFINYRQANKMVSYLWLLAALWFLVFLHILSARTGLLSVYLMALLTAVWLIIKKANWKTALIIIFVFSGLPFLAYKTIPSFHNRVNFFLYEKGYFEKTHYLPGSTDAMRIISIKAGWNLMQEDPLIGKGFGDIHTETRKWYAIHYPQMIEADKIEPSGEWLIYGSGAGWIGIILFTLSMLTPFITPGKNKLPWILLNAIAFLGFIFDVGLEVQFGVFIYAFTILSGWKWMKAEND